MSLLAGMLEAVESGRIPSGTSLSHLQEWSFGGPADLCANRCEHEGSCVRVMLAYLLERQLDKYWHDLDVTIAEGIDELGSLRGIELTIGQATCQKVPEPTGLSRQLLDAADIELPAVLPLRKVHVATRKKLVSTRH